MTQVIRHPNAITELWPSTGELCTRLAAQERAREKALRRLARLRKKASAEIDRLIAFLDQSDPYVMTELEDDDDREREDAEPDLGSIDRMTNQTQWAAGCTDDTEQDDCDREDDDPNECKLQPLEMDGVQ